MQVYNTTIVSKFTGYEYDVDVYYEYEAGFKGTRRDPEEPECVCIESVVLSGMPENARDLTSIVENIDLLEIKILEKLNSASEDAYERYMDGKADRW
jgi:hypothetical protein